MQLLRCAPAVIFGLSRRQQPLAVADANLATHLRLLPVPPAPGSIVHSRSY